MTMRTRLTAGLARFPPFAGRASSRWEFTWFIALMVLSGRAGSGRSAYHYHWRRCRCQHCRSTGVRSQASAGGAAGHR